MFFFSISLSKRWFILKSLPYMDTFAICAPTPLSLVVKIEEEYCCDSHTIGKDPVLC
jgi:hypothetical protein